MAILLNCGDPNRCRLAPVDVIRDRGVTFPLRLRPAVGLRQAPDYNPPLSLPLLPDDAASDAGRLARMARHDAAALGDLYDAHHRLLFGVICRIVGDRAEAEEVLQEAFV